VVASLFEARHADLLTERESRPTRAHPHVSEQPTLERFLRTQVLNATGQVTGLRPFRRDEFGTGPAAPTEAHIQAANALIDRLRKGLVVLAHQIAQAAPPTAAAPTTARLHPFLVHKERADQWTKRIEQIWDFYFELFGQRQGRYADWLLATDRIARDCYQTVYTHLGAARSVPSPPPFTYMRTGFTPATFRRGVPLKKLGKRANPFPIVELPYHRLLNPWTLGAVHHEVSHNLQSDLGLWEEVPRRIETRLRAAGIHPSLAGLWARWNKEIWADLCGLLLGGPSVVASLMDVVAMSPMRAQHFNPAGVHPTPYLRVLINLDLLQKMGFGDKSAMFRRLWLRLYPATSFGTLPKSLLDRFTEVARAVVDIICFEPYPQLGGKRLADVVLFEDVHERMTHEAAERLAQGIDPGIIPARFLVGATRVAIDRRLAPPAKIARNFYSELVTR
jgi:hypothetical protein